MIKLFAALVFVALSGAGPNLVRWTAPVDSRTSAQWLAESSGRVYAIEGGTLVAIAVADGATVWHSNIPASSAPAFFHGTIAVPAEKSLSFVDAQTGRLRKTLPMPAQVAVASAQSGIVAVTFGNEQVAHAIGFDARGTLKWTRTLTRSGNLVPIGLGGDAVAAFDYSGNSVVVLDAKTGNAVAQATYVDSLIGADGRYLWFSVAGGGIKGLDLDTNRSMAVHGHVIPKGVTVEHNLAVAVVDGRLHVIDLFSRSDRRLHVDGRWIGGPIAGKILVERGDGLYVQALVPNAKAVRVARYTSDSRIVAADRAVAYIGLLNGQIIAIDMRSNRLVQKLSTPCRFYEGFTASGKTSIVHCDSDASHSRLIAFDRVAAL